MERAVRMPHIKEAHDQRSEAEKGIAGADGKSNNRALKTRRREQEGGKELLE